MKSPHEINIQEKCLTCEVTGEGFFCHLPEADLERFQSIKVTRAYPKGSVLFHEGQPADAVYILCQGKVKLSACSRSGKIMILGIVEAGEVLGLSAALNGEDYEMSAEVLELCQVNYVTSRDLLRFLQLAPSACLNAARQLSRNYQAAYRQVCSIGLSGSVSDKLAKLFLEWSGKTNGNGYHEVRIRNRFTHEELAEMIGASRETVTRTLKYFREQNLITVKGSDITIHDPGRLHRMIGTTYRQDM